MTDRRLTQEVVEAAARLAAVDNPRRLTQLLVEAAARLAAVDNPRRLTQLLVEAAARLAAVDNPRRLTQIVIEVAWTNPVHPWVDTPFPVQPEFSPAYFADSGQEAITYASYFGIHRHKIELGKRGTRVEVLRR